MDNFLDRSALEVTGFVIDRGSDKSACILSPAHEMDILAGRALMDKKKSHHTETYLAQKAKASQSRKPPNTLL
jgi:hypothetical protein